MIKKKWKFEIEIKIKNNKEKKILFNKLIKYYIYIIFFNINLSEKKVYLHFLLYIFKKLINII